MREGGFFVPVALILFAAAAVIVPLNTPPRPAEVAMRTPERPPGLTVAPSRGSGRPADVEVAETMLAEFFGERLLPDDTQTTVLERVKLAAIRHGYAIDALIATLPDPIDSHSRWQFDPIQDAIQRAATRNGFVLDRFYIPDWRPQGANREAETDRNRLHEAWPGIILFRADSQFRLFREEEGPPPRRLLVTLLVFETPTHGVHLQAFHEAVRFIHALDAGVGAPLKILGPTFSGTSPSLRIALRNAEAAGFLPPTVRVVTGSATNVLNRAIIERDWPARRVSYSATVLSNEDMLLGVLGYLRATTGVTARRLALLTEQNTAYGQSARTETEEHRAAQPSEEQKLRDEALRIGFPLHISRLRAAANQAGTDAAPRSLVSRRPMHSLSLKDDGLITDQVPLFGDSTSPAYVELLLGNIFETLRRERITTVGLFATDSRDKLFLSQQLAQHCPNVRLFTIETDLLYAHPDYSTYMRGTLVASTYPLFNANQLWTAPGSGERWRSQFSTSNMQGVYNAFQVIIRPPASVDVKHLLEYSMPFQQGCGVRCSPPLWISVNGNAGMWPLQTGVRASAYVEPVVDAEAAKPADDVGRMLPVPAWAFAALVLLHGGVWVQIVAYVIGVSRLRLSCPPALARMFGRAAGPRRYLLSAFASIFLLLAFADVLLWTRAAFIYEGEYPPWMIAIFVVCIVTLVELVVLMLDIGRRRFPGLATQLIRGDAPGFGRWMAAYRAMFLFLLAMMFWHLCAALLKPVAVLASPGGIKSADGRELLFLFNRAVNLDNGVSPAVPVLLLCGALYLWGLQHFRTRGVTSRSTLRRRITELDGLRSQTAVCSPRGVPVVAGTKGPSLDGLAKLRVIVFWGFVLFQLCFYSSAFGMVGVTTIESSSYTRFFQYGNILLQGLIAVSIANFLFVWERTRRRLERFAQLDGVAGPLTRAFAALPPSSRTLGVFTRVPRLQELEDAVVRAEAIQRFSLEAVGFPRGSDAVLARQPEFQDGPDGPSAAELRALFERENAADPGQTFSDTETWPEMLRFTGAMCRRAAAVKTMIDQPSRQVTAWLQHVDNLVALDLVLIVRELSGRLVASMLLTLALTLMVLANHTWYPAQPRQVLMGFSWACILASALASVRVFIQMDRNEVISYIAGSRPNKLNWDLAFVAKLVLWVAVPLVSLFAAQFPDAGSALLQWLQPMQRALP